MSNGNLLKIKGPRKEKECLKISLLTLGVLNDIVSDLLVA
jgi:hypothetical protein